jgi:hypothetical protein
MNQNKPWIEIQEKLLAAYDFRPCRAEPLHIIARYLRMNNRQRSAYMFAKQAASLPYPQQDILFIDTGIYKWMCIDEVAATAFSVHDYKLGLECCKILLNENRLPASEVERVKANMTTYEVALENQRKNSPPQQVVAPFGKPYIEKTRTFKRRK